MADAEEQVTKRRRKDDGEGGAAGISEKAMKWAEEFDALEEDDQYTYLEELAPRMTKMHLQFLQGIIGLDEDDDEEEDFGEDDDDDDDEDGEGEDGDDDDE